MQGGESGCPADAVSTFDKTSLTNITKGNVAGAEDTRLWAHALSLYVITYIILSVRQLDLFWVFRALFRCGCVADTACVRDLQYLGSDARDVQSLISDPIPSL